MKEVDELRKRVSDLEDLLVCIGDNSMTPKAILSLEEMNKGVGDKVEGEIKVGKMDIVVLKGVEQIEDWKEGCRTWKSRNEEVNIYEMKTPRACGLNIVVGNCDERVEIIIWEE